MNDDEQRHLEPGMILLDPNDGSPQVWTVVSKSDARAAKLVAHFGSMHGEATLRDNSLPEGWAILANVLVARLVPGAIVIPPLSVSLSTERLAMYQAQVKDAVEAVKDAWGQDG